MSSSAEDVLLGVVKDVVKEVSETEVQVVIDMLSAIARGNVTEFERLGRLVSESLAAKAIVAKRFEKET